MADEYAGIPEATMGALERYVEHGIPTGSFLRAVLKNDLFDAIGRADIGNQHAIHAICMYIYNKIPGVAWGDEERVDAWIAAKGKEQYKSK